MRVLRNIVIAVLLAVLAGWAIRHAWLERIVYHRMYRFTAEEAERLRAFPQAQRVHGVNAWYSQDPEGAAVHLRRAVNGDPMDIGAWLRLAEAEQTLGRADRALEILALTDQLTKGVLRWKWTQTLLAQELGAENIFWGNINFLIRKNRKTSDALQLAELQAGMQTDAMLARLEPENWEAYLGWLMRWGRVADTYPVWEAMGREEEPAERLVEGYVHFLIGKRAVDRAAGIWERYAGVKGMTNPGFEQEGRGRGFHWSYGSDRKERWTVERTTEPAHSGDYALRADFGGKENLDFSSLSQIVAVEGGEQYALRYWWKGENLTTDKGPFVEVYGYRCKGLHARGPMLLGTVGWKEVEIAFTPPEECEAVVVRLRRVRSGRFDNKIAGTVWLDDFHLVRIEHGA